MRSSGGSQGFQMATLPLKYCPRLISICYVRLVGKHIFFDWCIPQAAFSDSAVSWLLFFVVFFSPPPPLLLFGPFVSGILTRRAQSPGLCWRPELFPLLARLLAGSPCWSERLWLRHLVEPVNHTLFADFFFFCLWAERLIDLRRLLPVRQHAHISRLIFQTSPLFVFSFSWMWMFQLSDWQRTLVWKKLFKYLHLTWEHAGVLNIFWPARLSQNPPITPQLPLPYPCEADRTWHGIHDGDLSESPWLLLTSGLCIALKTNKNDGSFVGWSCVDWLTESCWSLWQDCGSRFNFTSFLFFHTSI